MPALLAPGELAFGIQLPIQTLTRTLVDAWEDQSSPGDLVTIARAADILGYEFVGVCDHIAIPDNDYAAHMTTTWYDPVATLAYLGAYTEQVNLLSVVYIAAYRHPLQTAKSFATIDHLTGGRAILGVGAGHVEAEFGALGIDFGTRGRRLDDALAAISGAFDDEYVSHSGEFFRYDDMGVGPAPRDGELTIWVAGGGGPAFRRVGRYGHGFIPFVNSQTIPEIVAEITRAAGEAGRGDQHFDIGAMPPWMYLGDPPEGIGPHMLSGPPEAAAEVIRGQRDEGANVFHLKFRARDLQEYLDQLEIFATDVAPLVREP